MRRGSRTAEVAPITSTNPGTNHSSTQWWTPTFKMTFSILFITRITVALVSPIISDCDETFNFWEPLHYLQFGFGLQTWEYCPSNAIRSWAYVAMHALPMETFRFILPKWMLWALLRLLLATVSCATEAYFYRTVVEQISSRIGRPMLLLMVFAPGMHISAVAFLPSSFAMYTTMLVLASVIRRQTWPVSLIGGGGDDSSASGQMLHAVFTPLLLLAIGALVAWPFSAAIGIPFAVEEILLRAFYRPKLPGESGKSTATTVTATTATATTMIAAAGTSRIAARLAILIYASLRAFFIVLLPLMAIDRLFYRKWTAVPWNIIAYNVFGGGKSSGGPNVYGTEPWWFYLVNLSLNFNVAFLLALLGIPVALLMRWRSFECVVACVNVKFLASTSGRPYPFLVSKLVPFYWWFLIFSMQPHKEERFMFVLYPALIFNASCTLTMLSALLSGCLQQQQQQRSTVLAADSRSASPSLGTNISGKNSKIPLAVSFTKKALLIIFTILSISRLLALRIHYGGSIQVYHDFLAGNLQQHATQQRKLCLGREWFRFPSHYLLPEGIRVRFVRTSANGMLPRYFEEAKTNSTGNGSNIPIKDWLTDRPGTHREPKARFNRQNQEEMDQYTLDPAGECDYFVTVFEEGPMPKNDELLAFDRLAGTSVEWKRLACRRYLIATKTPAIQRAFYWSPHFLAGSSSSLRDSDGDDKKKTWGEYCILEKLRNLRDK